VAALWQSLELHPWCVVGVVWKRAKSSALGKCLAFLSMSYMPCGWATGWPVDIKCVQILAIQACRSQNWVSFREISRVVRNAL